MKSYKIVGVLLILLAVIGLVSIGSARGRQTTDSYTGESKTFTLEVVQHFGDKYLVVMDTRSSKLKVIKFDPQKLHNSMTFSDTDFSVFTLVP